MNRSSGIAAPPWTPC